MFAAFLFGSQSHQRLMLVNYLYLVGERVILAKEMAFFYARIPKSDLKTVF